MGTAFRLKTFPEILSNMLARARGTIPDFDIIPGAPGRTMLEAAALSDADGYVQMARLLDLFNLDNVQGDDLDERGIDYGANVYTALRRRPANTSITKVSAGDGSLLVPCYLASDAALGASTFTLVDGSALATSGTLTLERGSARQETVLYTRVGNVVTIVSPATGLTRTHTTGALVERVATQSLVVGALIIGATTVTLTAGTGAAWPATGSVILERNTLLAETKAFTRTGDVLTLGVGCSYAHISGIGATLSLFGSARAISAGSVCYVPATESTRQIDFRVVTSGVLLDGDLTSDLIDVVSVDVGADTRVGSYAISQWSSAPFINATVTNPVASARGADRESDPAYRKRLRDFIQSLTRGTPLAITTLVTGLQEPTTGATVAFAQIIEPVLPGVSYVYITDGTSSFALEQTAFEGRDVLIRDAEVNDRRGKLGQLGPFASAPTTPRLFTSVQRGVATSVAVNTLTDTAQAMVVNVHVGHYLKTDDDQFYLINSNSATAFTLTGGSTPSLGSYAVFDLAASPLVLGTDYQFNAATGDVELTTGLGAHDALIAASDGAAPGVGAYTYTRGLGAYVQRAINGDPTRFNDFPGIRAAGTQVLVRAPQIISQVFTLRVVPVRGYTDTDVSATVAAAVETYVNSLGIGANVILSSIIAAVRALPNVEDVEILAPTSNVVVSAGQLMRITAADLIIV